MYHQIYNRSTGTTVARFGVTNSRIFLIPLYMWLAVLLSLTVTEVSQPIVIIFFSQPRFSPL